MLKKSTSIFSLVCATVFCASLTTAFANTPAYAYLRAGEYMDKTPERYYNAGETITVTIKNYSTSKNSVFSGLQRKYSPGFVKETVTNVGSTTTYKYYIGTSGYYTASAECNYGLSNNCNADVTMTD